MKQANDYRRNAAECRRLAGATAIDKERKQLLGLANTWERLATDRENFVRTHPELHARMMAEEKPKPATRG